MQLLDHMQSHELSGVLLPILLIEPLSVADDVEVIVETAVVETAGAKVKTL